MGNLTDIKMVEYQKVKWLWKCSVFDPWDEKYWIKCSWMKKRKIQFCNCCPWGYASKLPKNEFPWLVKAATMTCDNPNSLDKYDKISLVYLGRFTEIITPNPNWTNPFPPNCSTCVICWQLFILITYKINKRLIKKMIDYLVLGYIQNVNHEENLSANDKWCDP